MKQLIYIICAGFLSSNILFAQECPHYEKVFNVYRRDKKAIDGYAAEFIKKNPEMFLYKQTSYLGKHELDIDESTFIPYLQTDSCVIANCIYVYTTDTLFAKIGFYSKDNRTKIILLETKNYYKDNYLKDFLYTRFNAIIEKYHGFLKSKNNDTTNW